MFYRVVFMAIVIAVPVRALMAQTVTVKDLMPLAVGQYVYYNEYDTATAGSAATTSLAYYESLQSGLSYQGATGVSVVRDTLGGGDPSGAHDLHYSFTSAGDLQAYADSALIADLIPSEIAAGITQMPNTWVDYFKLSAGLGKSYPITTLNSTVTVSGVTANVTVTVSGIYEGIEKVTVPKAAYDSAYRFDVQALVDISALGGLLKGNFTSTKSNWLVRGIGIVKTNAPIAGTTIDGNSIATIGTEKEMTAYGIAGAASVAPSQTQPSGISIYPNPASDEATISFDRPAKTILLYNPAGQMVRSFDIATHTGAALIYVQDLPNGMYLARVKFADGTSQSSEMVIQH
jgi:hypothetical protein